MSKCKPKKRILCFLLFFVMMFVSMRSIHADAAPNDKPIVIVIDAGHGGKSNGNEYFDLKEKDLNLAVAKSIKKNLETFEGIKVYLTRKDDKDANYTNRVDYAKVKKADYLISLHFNATEAHMQAGSMIYVSAIPDLRKKMMPIAQSVSESLEGIGIFANGVYTCVDEDGHDYLGFLRKCEEKKVSGMIIEHLFMDREEYLPLINSPEALDTIGKADALAIARALKLNSNSTIYHFTDEPDIETTEPYELPSNYMYPDSASVAVKEYEQITNRAANIVFDVNASDPQGQLASYRMSTDGGITFGAEKDFAYGGKSEFSRILRKGDGQKIVILALNQDHLGCVSNCLDVWDEIKLDRDFDKHKEEALLKEQEEEQGSETASEEIPEEVSSEEETTEDSSVTDHDPHLNDSQKVVVIFGAFAGLAIAVLLYFIYRKENVSGKE